MRSTFLVQVTADIESTEDNYEENAGAMASLLVGVFADKENLSELTKSAELTSCHSEIDVASQQAGLVGRALVEMVADKKVVLDKQKLSAAFKRDSSWKMKIEKRCIDQEAMSTC